MPCEVVTSEGANVFVCSHTHKDAQACAFCGAEDALYLCDWPVEKVEPIPICDVRHGDVVAHCRGGHVDQVLAKSVVLGIEVDGRGYEMNLGQHRLTALGRTLPRAQQMVVLSLTISGFSWEDMRPMSSFTTKVKVIRPGTCDVAACEAHVREVGDEVHYCADHWNSWQEGDCQ